MPRCGARRRRSTATDRSRGTSSAWQGGSGTGSSIPRGRAGDAIADCGLPIAESIGERRGVRTRPANPQSTIRTPQFFRGSRTMTGPRTVRAARGPERSCKGWIQEAALRMLMNNLDPEVAERPQDLVVYGGTGKAARDWPSFDAICRTLVTLGDDETLLVQSGRPVGVFTTHPEAPRVLIANANLVGRWATWDVFRELERRGLIMFGQMTAGSWIYIGTQGILQGTYETFGAVARRHFGGSLKGRVVLTGGLGGMGGAQPLAATMNEGVLLAVEVDAGRVRRRLETGYLDEVADSLDAALRAVAAAQREGRARSIGLVGNCADVLPELVRRRFVPDVLTDQTSAHDTLNGYVPAGLPLADAVALRRRDPADYQQRAVASIAAHVDRKSVV